MNTKAQTPLTIMFWFILVIIIWATFLSPIINTWGHQIVVTAGYTGIEALFYDNLNFVIGFILIISLLGVGYYGSTQ